MNSIEHELTLDYLFRWAQFSNIIYCVDYWTLATLDPLLFFQQLYYATFITHSTVFVLFSETHSKAAHTKPTW